MQLGNDKHKQTGIVNFDKCVPLGHCDVLVHKGYVDTK